MVSKSGFHLRNPGLYVPKEENRCGYGLSVTSPVKLKVENQKRYRYEGGRVGAVLRFCVGGLPPSAQFVLLLEAPLRG